MRYALLICTRPGMLDGFSESKRKAVYGEYVAVTELPGLVGTAQLQPVRSRTPRRCSPANVPFARDRSAAV
jgi:hypothetical protein